MASPGCCPNVQSPTKSADIQLDRQLFDELGISSWDSAGNQNGRVHPSCGHGSFHELTAIFVGLNAKVGGSLAAWSEGRRRTRPEKRSTLAFSLSLDMVSSTDSPTSHGGSSERYCAGVTMFVIALVFCSASSRLLSVFCRRRA